MKEHGLIAEKIAQEIFITVLNINNVSACKFTYWDKNCKKTCIWIKISKKRYVALELSLDKSILGPKGVEAIHKGIVPMWVDRNELENAFVEKKGEKMVEKTMLLIKKIVRNFSMKKFGEKPNWAL